MSRPFLGCIADDYTGATDVASMLTRAGFRVIQCFGVVSDQYKLQDCDAVVVALKSRSIAPKDAVKLSLEALHFLQSLGIEKFFFKYCSTFDSTAAGNIGPVADSLATALDASQVLFCPAFPENGRTVYCGHLFVHGVPLHESSMRHHPLTPMTDSNLCRVLAAQTNRIVSNLRLKASLPSTKENKYYIVDAITNDDLVHVAQQAKHHRLLTGGSAIAGYWAKAIAEEKPNHSVERMQCERIDPKEVRQTIILAGSCSDATRVQVAEFEKSYPVLHVDLTAFASLDDIVVSALRWCDAQWMNHQLEVQPLLISTSTKPELVTKAREKFGERGSADYAEQVFARVAKGLQQRGTRRFIVAGGETAGAVINSLEIQAVHIGREIAPGVPWITTLTPPELSLSLKSGNFGGPNFFLDALELPV